MKKLIILLLIVSGCSSQVPDLRQHLSLAGEWEFRIDSLDQGVENEWYNKSFSEKVKLPGSMAENGKGNEVNLNTDWTGDIVDSSYFNNISYEKYRQPGNFKIPFWLKPVKYYKGVAWYNKDVEISDGWKDKRIILFLERCHWKSTVFVNGELAGTGISLSTPHEYDITDLIISGKNRISIRIDNRVIVPVGVNSHSISDHTQTNWNGITGDISLYVTSEIFIEDVQVFPDVKNGTAKIIVKINNKENEPFNGRLIFRAACFNGNRSVKQSKELVTFHTNSDDQKIVFDYTIKDPELWSEFNPSLYKMDVLMEDEHKKSIDKYSVDFGVREFKTSGTHFEVNGIPVFLRGTTECCIFPLTGYPPSDLASWQKVLQTCKNYGLNHVRFHSFCPPEAAFIVADKLGIYLQIECSSWANQGTTIGDGSSVDQFIRDEGDRILKAYGNHPSFCMLAYGNEPAGKNQNSYLGELINNWKSKDLRRVYTSASGWPVIPENDYNLIPEPRIQRWGEGLRSIINAEPPQTLFDYHEFVSKYNIPIVSHEIGQWCAYPDFKEISKYTGVLRATNFEIFRESLSENHMGDRAEDFLMSSGKLQILCYKAEIEAALRTPGFGGFQILQLHDFPGQGTALVGILNSFFESKGYISPEEFRMFCNETVPLARMKKLIYNNNESFEAMVEISHFGAAPVKNAEIVNRVVDDKGNVIREEIIKKDEIKSGIDSIGSFEMDLKEIITAQKLTFEVSVAGTTFVNQWNFWVYPEIKQINPGNVHITTDLDKDSETILNNGGSVLLLTYDKVGKTKGAQVTIGFSSIFWNTAWTGNQPPHTLGILCNPEHPLFSDFPTEYHSNWQWWELVSHSQVMILDDSPEELKPLIQPIDTWFENRRLALAFEAKCRNGKLFVCSIDLAETSGERLVSKQLMQSLIKYMNSTGFNPEIEIDMNFIRGLTL